MPKYQRNILLLEEILEELKTLKIILVQVRTEISKLSQIENKLERGENLAKNNNGWFWTN